MEKSREKRREKRTNKVNFRWREKREEECPKGEVPNFGWPHTLPAGVRNMYRSYVFVERVRVSACHLERV